MLLLSKIVAHTSRAYAINQALCRFRLSSTALNLTSGVVAGHGERNTLKAKSVLERFLNTLQERDAQNLCTGVTVKMCKP